MTRSQLHQQLSEILYIEDYNLVDALIAGVVANASKLGDPVWLTIIGQSSGGKSQYLRPFHKGNPGMFVQIDDISENAFISGVLREKSLIFNIKKDIPGIITMDDLTVLFSKNSEQKNAVLAQLRMLYDGRLTRVFGNAGKTPECTWEGYAGMLAGSTPAIYRHFSEVADMGERFVMYRMKDVDEEKMMDVIENNPLPVRVMDEKIAAIYNEYISGVMKVISEKPELLAVELDDESKVLLRRAALAGTALRTPVLLHAYGEYVLEEPVKESPLRVWKQLLALAKTFMMLAKIEDPEVTKLPTYWREAVEWVAYSIADDKRRALYKAVLYLQNTPEKATVDSLARYLNKDKQYVKLEMKKMNAIGVIHNDNTEGLANDYYSTGHEYLTDIVRRLDPPPEFSQPYV